MISWKHSLEKLNEEYETAKKKREALDNLLNGGRISKTTHDLFNIEIDEALKEIEKQQKALLQKMSAKMVELEDQIKTLEILLTNFEIQHVTGEVDEEVYQRQINVLSLGLETAKGELEAMKNATDQVSSSNVFGEESDAEVVQDSDLGKEESEETSAECVEAVETVSSDAEEHDVAISVESAPTEPSEKSEENPAN